MTLPETCRRHWTITTVLTTSAVFLTCGSIQAGPEAPPPAVAVAVDDAAADPKQEILKKGDLHDQKLEAKEALKC